MAKVNKMQREASRTPLRILRKLRVESLEERQLLSVTAWGREPAGPPPYEVYLRQQASQVAETSERSCERDVITIPNTILFQASQAEYNSSVSCPELRESVFQADDVEQLLAELEPLAVLDESSTYDTDSTPSTDQDLSDDELPVEILFADADLIDLDDLSDVFDDSLQPGAQTNSGGGNQGLAPLLVSGGSDASGYADYVFSADGSTFESYATWFINPPDSGSLSYSVQSSLSIVSVSIDSATGWLSITPTGTVGTGSFTVTATNDVGSRSVQVSVYCGRVIGYSLEERAYGEDWSAVDDSAADGSWDLLWQENEYRWTPIFESNLAPPSYKIQNVQASSRLLDSTGAYATFASNSYAMYSSASGGSYEAPEPAWPYAIGVPSQCGECDVDLSVSIQGYHPSSSTEVCLGTNSVVLTLDKTRPTSVTPRIGVNKIQSVTWTAPDANIRLETYKENSPEMRCFPERPSQNEEIANQVYATVTLTAEVPTGMSGTVYVHYFDPVNPLGSLANLSMREQSGEISLPGRFDNYGAATLSAMTLFANSASGSTLRSTLTINQACAGDDYIAVAHPNNVIATSYNIEDVDDVDVPYSVVTRKDPTGEDGYSPLSLNLQSPVLTVWRTLWVELDRMTMDNGALALTAFIGNVTTHAFAQACISVQVYEQSENINPTLTAFDVIYNETTRSIQMNNSERKTCTDCRNSDDASDSFWTVHAIGAFKLLNESGLLKETVGLATSKIDTTIFLFDNAIKSVWTNYESGLSLLNVDIYHLVDIVTCHELGHLFLDSKAHEELTVMDSYISRLCLHTMFYSEIDQVINKLLVFNKVHLRLIQSRLKPGIYWI